MGAIEGPDPDQALVRLAQAGDVDAFGVLVDRHRRAVVRAAAAALGSANEADDVAQEAFVTAFRKLGTFRGDALFRTWLLAITWRKALDRRKSLTRWIRRLAVPAREEDESPIEQVPSGPRTQEDGLLASELQAELRTLMTSLPHKLRDVLLLAGSGDYSYGQISGMLGIPVGTVKWRVSEARRVLKQKLAAKGFTNV